MSSIFSTRRAKELNKAQCDPILALSHPLKWDNRPQIPELSDPRDPGVAANGNGNRLQESAPGVSTADRVYGVLHNAIMTHELPPGATISRAELARSYNVSQTPVREAILRLEREGLVQVFPQARTVVSKIDLPRLFEAQFQRVTLEIAIVRRLARRPSQSLVQDLHRSNAQMQSRCRTLVTLKPSNSEVMNFDRELDAIAAAFHRSLFEAAGMPTLFERVMAELADLDRCRALSTMPFTDHRMVLEFHNDIQARIAARDPKGAESAMRALLSDGLGPVAKLAREYPEFFNT